MKIKQASATGSIIGGPFGHDDQGGVVALAPRPRTTRSELICSGSLLAPNLVSTARHCVSQIGDGSSEAVDCASSRFTAKYDARPTVRIDRLAAPKRQQVVPDQRDSRSARQQQRVRLRHRAVDLEPAAACPVPTPNQSSLCARSPRRLPRNPLRPVGYGPARSKRHATAKPPGHAMRFDESVGVLHRLEMPTRGGGRRRRIRRQ